MIKTISFEGELYPEFQSTGNAAQFAIPFAKQVCKGRGYDIGCGSLAWALPDSIPIDLEFKNGYDANNLRPELMDYIFSIHCLEHVDDWVRTLDYWTDHLKPGGTLFLYLPHKDQKYWRPWNDRKHKHMFCPEDIENYLKSNNFDKIFCSGRDLNHSFCVMAEKSCCNL